jgi:hypothetical protein
MRIVLLSCLPLFALADVSVRAKSKAPRFCVAKATSAVGGWSPTPKQIAALEGKLRASLPHLTGSYGKTDLFDGYLRHYRGVIRGGKKLIEIYAWEPEDGAQDPCNPPGIDDGGCSVWSAIFDPKSEEVREFYCNGDG